MLRRTITICIAVVVIMAIVGAATPSYAGIGSVRNWIGRKIGSISSDETLAENAREEVKTQLKEVAKKASELNMAKFKADKFSSKIQTLERDIGKKETYVRAGIDLLKTSDPDQPIRFPDGSVFAYNEVNKDILLRVDELKSLVATMNDMVSEKAGVEENIKNGKDNLVSAVYALKKKQMQILQLETGIIADRIKGESRKIRDSCEKYSTCNFSDSRAMDALRRRSFEVDAENQVGEIMSGEVKLVQDVPLESLIPDKSGIEAAEEYFTNSK